MVNKWNKPKKPKELEIKLLHIDHDGLAIFLYPLEAEIMDYIWDNIGERYFTAKEITGLLVPRKPMTIMTTIIRLRKKGLFLRIGRGIRDNPYKYMVSMDRQTFIDRAMNIVISKLKANDYL